MIGLAKEMNTLWCVYEHWLVIKPGEPPQIIYVGACRLPEVFDMRNARNNSDWSAIFQVDREIMLSIIMTTPDQREAMNFSIRHAKGLPEMPRCNLHGFNMFGQSRRLLCSNGQEYTNQTEAAKVLGLNQGAISRHLKGHLQSVKGLVFTYKGAPTL
jgi:hypothetical protein